ncbi:unnamed protein product [Gongylonema pulchrum]|uniref:Col_cuticle_N domain-containing protein n=1 Tax=Gongylonema pulchrum TaxID=637853 RepID=A0A183ERG3_9BILA|nr:unnamed protein product [Gongylonema pulchrum]
MKGEQVAGIISVVLCAGAVLTSLIVTPSLYDQINQLSYEVFEEVNAFKVEYPFIHFIRRFSLKSRSRIANKRTLRQLDIIELLVLLKRRHVRRYI